MKKEYQTECTCFQIKIFDLNFYLVDLIYFPSGSKAENSLVFPSPRFTAGCLSFGLNP